MYLEANLTDLTIDTLINIVGKDTPRELAVNHWMPEAWEVTIGSGNASGLIDYFVSCYLNGEKLIVATDSQKFGEQLERVFAELAPDARVFRADGKTKESDEVREFLTKPNQVIEREKPDLLIYSPTMESGGDITSDWFDRMGFYLVNLETRAQMQMLGRVRASIPRVGYVLDYANPDESSKTLRPDILKEDLRKNVDDAVKLVKLAAALAKEENPDNPDWLTKLNEMLDPKVDSPEEFWVTAGCNYQFRIKGARSEMRENLVKALKEAGHKVTETQFSKTLEVKALREEIKELLEEEEAAKLYEADDSKVTPEMARKILERSGSSEKKRFQARKALLREKLPGLDLTKDFLLEAVVQNYGHLLKGATLHWYCQHPQVVEELEKKKFIHHLKQPFVYLPKVKEIAPKVALLRESGLFELIGDREYRDTDEDLQKLRQWALWNVWEIRRVLGLRMTESQTGIQVLSKLLKRVGFKLDSRRLGPRKARHRVYWISNIDDEYHQKIGEALSRRYASLLSALSSDVVSNTYSINDL